MSEAARACPVVLRMRGNLLGCLGSRCSLLRGSADGGKRQLSTLCGVCKQDGWKNVAMTLGFVLACACHSCRKIPELRKEVSPLQNKQN